MSEAKPASQPSSGFRWLILAGGVIISLCIGLLYLWSIYVKPMCEQFGWATDQVALMGNVLVATLCLGAFIGGQLLPRVGAKTCGIIGAVLFGGFMFISSFVASPVIMYITYGVISGTGCGILYNSIMYTLGFWFPDRRGLVMGIYLGVFGLASTIWAKPISGLLTSIGVRATMRLTGLIFFAAIFLVAVFILRMPPEGWLPEGYVPPVDKVNSNSKFLVVREGLRTKTFWLITLAQVLLVITYNFISSYVVVYIVDVKALTTVFAVTVVAAMGVGSFFGRLTGGFLADRIGNKLTYLVACLASVIACIALVLTADSSIIEIMFFLVAFGYGTRTPVYGTLAVDNFGAKNSSALAGFTNLFTIITSLLSGVMTAAIREATGSYNGAFYVAVMAAVIGCTCILMLPKAKPVDTIAKSAELQSALEPEA